MIFDNISEYFLERQEKEKVIKDELEEEPERAEDLLPIIKRLFTEVESVFLRNKQEQNSALVQNQTDLASYNLFSRTYFDVLIDKNNQLLGEQEKAIQNFINQFYSVQTSKKKKKAPCKVLILVGDEVNDTQYANQIFGEVLRQKLNLNIQRVTATQHRTQNLMKSMAESSQHNSVK